MDEKVMYEIISALFDEACKLLEARYSAIEFERRYVLKNNGVELQALVAKQEGVDVTPAIYLNSLAEAIYEGDISVKDAAAEVERIYQNHLNDMEMPTLNRESACENLYAVVINAEQNKDLLERLPHQIVNDLAVVPRFRIDDRASFWAHNDLCAKFEMTPSELIEQAISNTVEKSQYRIENMSEILRGMIGPAPDDVKEELQLDSEIPMLVVTNQSKYNGAVEVVVNPKCREQLHKLLGDYYLLPSSIHEMIAVPADLAEVDELVEMIRDVNAQEVNPEERLGEHPYFVGPDMVLRNPSPKETPEEQPPVQKATINLHI